MALPAIKENSGRWQPGQSGNPAGRPARIRALEDALFEEFSPKVREVMQQLYVMVMDGGKAAPPAAKLFLERIMGLQRQPREDGAVTEEGALNDPDFWAKVLASPAVRATVLQVIQGGKP